MVSPGDWNNKSLFHVIYRRIHEGVYTRFYERAGALYWLEILNYVTFSGAGVREIFIHRRNADRFKKRQLDYMLAAAAIGFLCGITTMPLVYRIHLPPIAAPLVAIYPVVSTYAILRHQLLDIRIIIRRTLIYSAITAVLSTLYVTVVALGSRMMDRWSVSPSLISSATAAALVAILCHPVRLWLNRWVDRRFPREALDPILLREATGTFVHEVKRPLVNISLPAQLALDDVLRLKDGKGDAAETIQALERRLRFIIEESHAAGEKIEAICELTGSGRPVHEAFAFGPFLELLRKTYSARAAKDGVTIRIHSPDGPLTVQGNRRQLEIAFGNLISNALDALNNAPSRKEIEISVRADEERLYVEVADTGPGIAPKMRSRIFESWFSTKGAHGMGIGLYIAMQIIQRHGGSLSVDNLPEGAGTVFVLSLPRRPKT